MRNAGGLGVLCTAEGLGSCSPVPGKTGKEGTQRLPGDHLDEQGGKTRPGAGGGPGLRGRSKQRAHSSRGEAWRRPWGLTPPPPRPCSPVQGPRLRPAPGTGRDRGCGACPVTQGECGCREGYGLPRQSRSRLRRPQQASRTPGIPARGHSGPREGPGKDRGWPGPGEDEHWAPGPNREERRAGPESRLRASPRPPHPKPGVGSSPLSLPPSLSVSCYSVELTGSSLGSQN